MQVLTASYMTTRRGGGIKALSDHTLILKLFPGITCPGICRVRFQSLNQVGRARNCRSFYYKRSSSSRVALNTRNQNLGPLFVHLRKEIRHAITLIINDLQRKQPASV
jgi:hypothetical protein